MWATCSDFLPKKGSKERWEGDMSNFTVEKTNRHSQPGDWGQYQQDKSCSQYITLIWYDENGNFSVPKSHNTNLIQNKTSDKPQLRSNLQNSWPVPLRSVKVTKTSSLRNCLQPRRTYRDMKTKYNSALWMGSWDRKGVLDKKNKEIWNKYRLLMY